MKVFDQDNRMKAEVLKDQFFTTWLGGGESETRLVKKGYRKGK